MAENVQFQNYIPGQHWTSQPEARGYGSDFAQAAARKAATQALQRSTAAQAIEATSEEIGHQDIERRAASTGVAYMAGSQVVAATEGFARSAGNVTEDIASGFIVALGGEYNPQYARPAVYQQ